MKKLFKKIKVSAKFSLNKKDRTKKIKFKPKYSLPKKHLTLFLKTKTPNYQKTADNIRDAAQKSRK